jgi:hypothetical protein
MPSTLRPSSQAAQSTRKFEVTEIYGLRLAYVNNQVRYGRTLTEPAFGAATRQEHALLSERVEEWKVELVITDFEPSPAMWATTCACL